MKYSDQQSVNIGEPLPHSRSLQNHEVLMEHHLEEIDENVDRFFEKDPRAFYKNSEGKTICRSVHGKDPNHRRETAKREAEKTVIPNQVEIIIKLVNDFFSRIGITKVGNPKMSLSPNKKIDYVEIKNKFNLESQKDILWIKFTTDGYVGVIAQSDDVNFDIPNSSEEYDMRKPNGEWKYTSAGILIHSLGKRWDTTFVLLFPLHKEDGCTYDRHEIETAVGNYLEDKGIPVLDYYSHNY